MLASDWCEELDLTIELKSAPGTSVPRVCRVYFLHSLHSISTPPRMLRGGWSPCVSTFVVPRFFLLPPPLPSPPLPTFPRGILPSGWRFLSPRHFYERRLSLFPPFFSIPSLLSSSFLPFLFSLFAVSVRPDILTKWEFKPTGMPTRRRLRAPRVVEDAVSVPTDVVSSASTVSESAEDASVNVISPSGSESSDKVRAE